MIAVIGVLMLLIFKSISCNKANNQETTKFSGYGKVYLFKEEYEAKNVNKSDVLSEGPNCLYGELSNNSFIKLFKKIKEIAPCIENKEGSQISTYILYSDKGYKMGDINEIKGISIFTVNESTSLEHKLYKIIGGVCTEVNQYKTITDFITYFDIDFFVNLFSISGQRGCVMFRNGDLKVNNTLKREVRKDNLTKVILDQNNNMFRVAPDKRGCTKGGPFGSGCGTDSTFECNYSMQIGWFCGQIGPICSRDRIIDSSNVYDLLDESDSVSSSEAYGFRDDFMLNYSIGRKYIEYYYKISEVMHVNNTLDFSNLWDHINLMIKTYRVSRKLANGNSSDIIVDDEYRNLGLSMIQAYRTITTNQEFRTLLTDIENDLNYFHGKTRAQVLSLIQ